jgi:hemolysin activation/secretion protein
MRSAEPRTRRSAAAALAAAFALSIGAAPAAAFQLDRERQSYPVTEFVVEYALDHPDNPPLKDVLDLEVGLRATEEGFVAPRPVDRTYRMKLSSLPPNARFFPSALQHINWYIVLNYSRLGLDGVLVSVPDIEPGTGRDLRPPGETALHLRIWTGRIAQIATLAEGDRFKGLTVDERTNPPAYEWILALSPVQPGGKKDLLRIEAVNDYAFELSRHPGRRVDAELSPGPQVGTTRVTYRIAENKPWLVYAQYANTGTDATTGNRQRFGFTHNQLLGRDDILRLDYTTGDFDEVNGITASYEAPFTLRAPQWRGGVFGGASQFDAAEVGFSLAGFTGRQWAAGGQVTHQTFQRGQLFVDVQAGARWQWIEVKNRLLGTKGDSPFLLPNLGAVASRNTASSALRAGLNLEGNLGSLAGTESGVDLDVLGRIDADRDFAVLQWDGAWSFYLEPLLNRAAWLDPSTPRSSTLAHELAFSFQGQWAFDFRLIPNFQQVAGGLTTVRGYPQSATAGDTVVTGSAEYRFHLPRLFRPDPEPPELPLMGRFRARPQHLWGRPDWDLIFRAFFDGGYVHPSSGLGFEQSESLMGVGGGIELQFLRNLSLRFDAGVALSDLSDGSTRVGDTEFYVVGTVLY